MGGLLSLVLVIILVAIGIRWVLELSGRGEALPPGVDAQRLERIESALSTLESRLDDLQDQQRFLEGLLGDRKQGSLPPGPSEEETGERSILFDVDRDSSA